MITRLGQLLIKQAEEQNTSHHYLTPTHFALIKYAAVMEKLAARWHDMIANMSPLARHRLISRGLKEGWVKKPEQIATGINKGTDNMLDRLGYTEVNVTGATPAQLQEIREKAEQAMWDAVSRGDNFNAQWHRKIMQNVDEYTGRPFQHEDVTRGKLDSFGMNPTIKAVYTRNAQNSLGFVDELRKKLGAGRINGHIGNPASAINKALMRRHELYEAQEFEHARQSVAKLYEQMKEANPNLMPLEELMQSSPRKLYEWITSFVKSPGKFYAIEGNNSWKIGNHVNSNVLAKERNVLDRVPYRGRNGVLPIETLRRNITWEYDLMDSVANYVRKPGIARMNKKQRNAFNKYPNNRDVTVPTVTLTQQPNSDNGGVFTPKTFQIHKIK